MGVLVLWSVLLWRKRDLQVEIDLHVNLFNDMESFQRDFPDLFDETDQFMLSSPYCEPLNDWEYQPDDRTSPATVTSASSPESMSREESLFLDDTDPKLWHLQQLQGSPCSDVSVQSPTTPLPDELECQDLLQYSMKVSNLDEPVLQNGSLGAISSDSESETSHLIPTATSMNNSAPHGLTSDVATSNLQTQKNSGSLTASSKTNIEPAAPCNTTNSTSTRGRKRKSAPDTAEEEITDPVVARNAKNAIAARENRLKKKKYVEGLESEVSSLKAENETLLKENDEHKQLIKDLTAQLEYHKSVLYNQSSLSQLLKSMNPEPKLRLGSSVGGASSCVVKEGQKGAKFTQMSGGVCLHVNGPNASLEFCAKCSVMSQATFNS